MGAISDGIATNSISIMNLENIEAGEKEIFKDSARFNENAIEYGETINKNYVAFDYIKDNTLHIYLYDLSSSKLSDLLDTSIDEGKEYPINVALTEDNYLIFSMPSDNGNYQEMIAPVADFGKKEVLIKSLTLQNRISWPDKINSTDYIVWGTYSPNNDETENKLNIFNRKTGTLNTINWFPGGKIYFVDSDKIILNEIHYDTADSSAISTVFYLLDLKANGF